MKLHCLGTTGYHPSPSRHTACYYLPDWSIVLDAGTGIFRIVEHLLESPKQSLTILLSHAHLDHVVGLTFLVDALAVTSLEHVRLIGDQEKLDAVREHLYHELLFPVEPSMEFVALDGPTGSMEVNSVEVEWFPLEHPGGSLGFCMKHSGRKLAYVTDTVARPEGDYVKRVTEADLLLHECYFSDDYQPLAEKTGHSWLSAVTEVVKAARPKRSALIHINPLAEVLGEEFSLDAEHEALNMFIATDEMAIDF